MDEIQRDVSQGYLCCRWLASKVHKGHMCLIYYSTGQVAR